MNQPTRQGSPDPSSTHAGAAVEDSTLDAVLNDSDQLLAGSLRDDQRRQQRRRRWVVASLLFGGIVMSVLAYVVAAALMASPGAAVAQTEGDPAARSAEGWRLWQAQEFGPAQQQFEMAVELDPKAADAWNGLGWSRFNGGDAEGAVPAFEKCVELEPRHPAALNGLGQIYLMWRDYDRAETYLKKASPQASAAWFGLARLYLLTGDYPQAQRWARKALAQSPTDEGLKRIIAAARAKQVDPDLRAMLEGPGRPDAAAKSVGEGWRLMNTGKRPEAIKLFRDIIAQDDQSATAWNGLGWALMGSGEVAEAKAAFEACLELDADALGAMNGLARCLYADDQLDEAVALWLKMHAKAPAGSAASVGLAGAYMEQGEPAKAVPYYRELVKAVPDSQAFRDGLKAAQAAADESKSE
ncbi:Cellulose synthase operon protein C precursor [Pirellulimonas nuda]|uniref:Cellulose synthase operon protein C n=1 Tax=Pirellulimonas nuda TaxID=2528009 RepID=A0A518DI86_9BACT|nr:tetratricopeptide repeat protein [Pirellulimonas nuda]QDU91112.1 Cellulose synthase operon protein C precursor [Pirellulimonas nuda]